MKTIDLKNIKSKQKTTVIMYTNGVTNGVFPIYPSNKHDFQHLFTFQKSNKSNSSGQSSILGRRRYWTNRQLKDLERSIVEARNNESV